MSKFLSKWIRKFHRWLVIPFIPLFLTVVIAHGTTIGNAIQPIQQALMLIMALSGAYLYFLPYWVKWKRDKAIQMKEML